MLSPLPRRSVWAYCFAQSPSGVSLPRYGIRVGLRIVLFEACSAFTRVTACTLALSPYIVTRFTEGFQSLCYLHDCSGCFRLEHSPGGAFTHWKSAALSRRTPRAAVRPSRSAGVDRHGKTEHRKRKTGRLCRPVLSQSSCSDLSCGRASCL